MTKNKLTLLDTIASASAIDVVIQKKMRGRGVVRIRKRITPVNSNQNFSKTIGIIKSENSVV